jgi:hypothetical protein
LVVITDDPSAIKERDFVRTFNVSDFNPDYLNYGKKELTYKRVNSDDFNYHIHSAVSSRVNNSLHLFQQNPGGSRTKGSG